MIRSKNIIIDKGLFYPTAFDEIPDHEKIVDAPSGIVFPGIEPLGPPGIFHRIRVEMAIRCLGRLGSHHTWTQDLICVVTLLEPESGTLFWHLHCRSALLRNCKV